MVNANKILTVSYGTFSCTLEGFDDPFSTMRSIAEYFRDLAADDRYFGAEPPTPDAEMLHRIAEREIQRRVEAQVQDNGVVLRQVADQTADTADIETPAEAPAETPAPAAETPAEPVAAEEPPFDADADDSVAAKLARIRAAVARSRAETEPLINTVFAEDEHAEPLYRPAPETGVFEADAPDAAPAEEAGTETEAEVEVEVEAASASGPEADTLPDIDDIKEPADTGPAPDAVAAEPADTAGTDEAKDAAALDDIAGAVTDSIAADGAEDAIAGAVAEEAEFAEAEIGEAAIAEAEEIAEADIADVVAEEPVAETAPDATAAEAAAELPGEDDRDDDETVLIADEPFGHPAEPDQDAGDAEDTDFAAMLDAAVAASADETAEDEADVDTGDLPPDLGSVLAGGLDETAAEEETAEAETADLPTGAEFAPQVMAGDAAADGDDADAAPDLSVIGFDAPDGPGAPEATADDDIAKLILTEQDLAAEAAEGAAPDAPLGAPRVRVTKMRRDEFEAQFAPIEDAAGPDRAVDEDEIRATLGETGLSAEDEEDLISELVEVERGGPETAKESPETVSETLEALVAEASATEADDEPAGTGAPVGADDAAVDRLLARADTALEDQEGTRRRSAIAHLKAAVAAVRADGDEAKNSAAAETARTMDQYRQDLARAVRPQPVGDAAAAETSPETRDASRRDRPRRRMPPLMLVSEQRIDKDTAPSDAAPVRPRRIQADDLDREFENELFGDDTAAAAADATAGNLFSETGDFQSYVAETGAEGPQELLEASLAYGLNVEGAQFNSRPQIMKRMLGLFPDGAVTREDGLRAFGVLLREGRIIRIRRGRFQLPETSRFYQDNTPPEAEANSA